MPRIRSFFLKLAAFLIGVASVSANRVTTDDIPGKSYATGPGETRTFKYLWGPDIAGGTDGTSGAGGAGGLLLIRETKGDTNKNGLSLCRIMNLKNATTTRTPETGISTKLNQPIYD